jgi:hypothetical protein
VTTDPLSELRELKTAALEQARGDDLVAEYRRGAIEMVWTDLTGESTDRLLDDSLRVEIRDSRRVPAHAIAAVADGLQDAAARIARWQTNPEIDQSAKISSGDRRRAQIIQDAQIGNVVFYRIEAPTPDGLDISDHDTAAQRALRKLLEYLPEREDDDGAVDGILGSEPAVRLAVKSVSDAAKAAGGLDLDLDSRGAHTKSILTRERAAVLAEELARQEERTRELSVFGTLDGMRGTRHVAYLIPYTGGEIAASADDDVLQDVRRLIGQQVRADLIVTETRTATGRARTTYRLVHVSAVPTFPDV